eukprot:PhF_6_TR37416/c0_g1_i1/m.54999
MYILHKEVSSNPKNATVWCDMGSLLQEMEHRRTGVYNPEATFIICGVKYTSRGCYEKCVECDENYSTGWMMLGYFGKGGMVNGSNYSGVECCEMAITISRKVATHWHALGFLGGGHVLSVLHDAKMCFVMALE